MARGLLATVGQSRISSVDLLTLKKIRKGRRKEKKTALNNG